MRSRLALAALVAVLAWSAAAGAALPSFELEDLGESGALPRLYRGPDDRLHLLYVTDAGFRWRIWQAGAWTDAGLVPGTAKQSKSKFNNVSIVALADGSFHVLWGPAASWGVSHDVWLMSHDGASWTTKQTILPDYTEYLQLAPLPGNQLMVIGGIVCPSGCTAALPMAQSSGQPGGTFSNWTAIPIGQSEAKTPFVFVEPKSDVFHLVSRWARVSHLRWDGAKFGPESLLFPKSPYSVALPGISATPSGEPLITGVEWMGSGTTWAIDHVRFAAGFSGGWSPDAQGENVSGAVWDRSAVSGDAHGGVHLFYFAKAGELSYRYTSPEKSTDTAVVATNVAFSGPETDNLAASYTDHHVHVIVPVGGTLHHLQIETDPAPVDAGGDAPLDAGDDASSGSGGSDAGATLTGGATGATEPANDSGCGCQAPGRNARGWAGLSVIALALVRRRRARR